MTHHSLDTVLKIPSPGEGTQEHGNSDLDKNKNNLHHHWLDECPKLQSFRAARAYQRKVWVLQLQVP